MKGSGAFIGSVKKLSKTRSTEQHPAHQALEKQSDKYSISEIKDYCFCPLYYRFKHISGIECKKGIPGMLLDCIYKATYFIFYAAQGRFPNRGEVKNAYNRILRAMLGAKRLKGVQAGTINRSFEQLMEIYEFIRQNEYKPVIIGQNYNMKIDDSLSISGKIDAVCINSNGYELLLFMPDKMGSSEMPLACDIEVIAAALACRSVISEPISKVTVFYISSGTNEEAVIDNRDIKAMELIIKSAVKAIKEGIYYPAMSKNCKSECPYIAFCSNGKWIAD